MRNSAGLTLIEVLIALSIIAIAMTAIIKATAQSIRGNTYLENKMQALWVGEEVMSEAKLGLLKSFNEDLQTKTMLGKEWKYTLIRADTPNQSIKQLKVKVLENEKSTPLIQLESYANFNTNNNS